MSYKNEKKTERKKLLNFKSVSIAAAAAALLPGSKSPVSEKDQQSPADGNVPLIPLDISLSQAARDGLIDVVKCHVQFGCTAIHDMDQDGYTPLHHAARYNRVNVIEALVEAGGDVNIKGGQDESRPLHMACRYNNGSVTQLLLSLGVDVNVQDIKGKTPLHFATRRGHDMVTKMLLSASTCDANIGDNDKTTPLIMAAVQGKSKICELLISRGADIQQKDANDMNALMWASAEGHKEVAQLLLKAAQKHGLLDGQRYLGECDKEGSCALHLAVQNGSIEVCELLINNCANVNAQTFNLTTPLHIAAVQGYEDIAMLLIINKAEVNKKDAEQMTPCHKAALYNKVNLIKLLMCQGGDINAKDKQNMCPIHCACWKGQNDAVLFLLENGAQIAEVDVSLRTPLHWAIKYSHYETLLTLLKPSMQIVHGGDNLLEASDKNDQTVLHYASHSGNVSVVKTLLDAGANPGAKDQEERTPLHIAAQYDNVSCVEALISASNHETNDGDMDGRTPLLLGCSLGHFQVVQILVSLGADVSKRDDEHCTALMLAGAQGHMTVMRLLLDNQASVNDQDKMKNTALHYACVGGHVDAVQQLLDKHADVTQKNSRRHIPLDMAIQNLHSDVACVMLRHRSWRESLSIRDNHGMTALDRIIAKVPEAAKVVLDHCMERSSRDDDDPNLMMVFDYQYLDPGPEDSACKQNRYFALRSMVEHERDMLLSHPVCQTLLSQKWVKFGRRTFYWNLFIYTGYLVSLTFYVGTVDHAMLSKRLPCDYPYGDADNSNRSNLTTQSYESLEITTAPPLAWGIVLTVFILLFFLRETFKLFHQKGRYIRNFFNWIAWFLMGATYAFIHPPGLLPCVTQWRAGWMAMFFAWINFIMYLRRIDFVGMYVIMFVTVLTSLLKAILMFFFFAWAFAGSFYIIMSNNKPGFADFMTSMLNVFVMTLGEIEYVDNFLPMSSLHPFQADVNILLIIFIFLMPIVLMNLLIGIAVGDIEKVQHNAYLKRLGLQVDLLYQMENGMPKFMQRRVYVRRATIKPNEGRQSKWLRPFRLFFGSARNVEFIQAEQKDRVTHTLDHIKQDIRQQHHRVKSLQMALQQQTSLLQQICSRLDITDSQSQDLQPTPPTPQPDTLSIYDNVGPRRKPSYKPPLGDRPRSTWI